MLGSGKRTLAGLAFLCSSQLVWAHFAAWHPGMYCLNGTKPGVDDHDNNEPVSPLFQLRRDEWWFHHINRCDEFPPDEGVFLELPANGEFTVEHAVNRAFTTLSFGGERIGEFGDGGAHPEFSIPAPPGEEAPCIGGINIHTQNESMAAGTIFAISYQSEIPKVTPENLVVFTVLHHTPWKRIATYKVPDLPACPEAGCTCAWGWVANGCGEPNMYMQGFKCKVTGKTGTRALAPARPPVWCEDDPSKCTPGAKQMVFWQQLEGDNIVVEGWDLSGHLRYPTYNEKLGFANGAQNDIFLSDSSASIPATSIPPTQAASPTSTRQPTPGTNQNGATRVTPITSLICALLVVAMFTL